MDKPVKEIIKQIATIQIDALISIINKPIRVDHTLLRRYLQIEDDSIRDAASRLCDIYQQLRDKPETICLLNEYQLYICSHILFRMEDEWITDNSSGVAGAWAIIMNASEKFHQELNLVILR